MFFNIYGENAMWQLLGWILVFVGLIVFNEIARRTKTGGIFFFHTFNRTFLSYLLVIKGVEWCVNNTPKNMHVYSLFIKPSELQSLCIQHRLIPSSLIGLHPHFCSLPFLKRGSSPISITNHENRFGNSRSNKRIAAVVPQRTGVVE